MALVLSMQEGDRVFVNDTPVLLRKTVEDDHFVLEVDGHAFDITGDKGTEILPDVVVSAGNHPEWQGMVQVTFTAPRSKRILRQELYLREKQRAAGGQQRPSYASGAALRPARA